MIRILSWIFIVFLLTSCYSFKGISIDPDVFSFKIEPVEDVFYSSPASYPVEFSEALTQKIRKDSRLTLNNSNPDLIFRCKITKFDVSSQAPQPGIFSAINRCTISLEVEMQNTKNEKQNWKSGFSRYQDFDANVNFSSIQQQITSDINLLLVEDIFNKAFTNW
ncbi:MAG: hypothetical protein IPM34_11635 [Saprospiraceae bacterium]|nr:hypothetical protein [Saprospiraceae bacterium]